MKYKTVSDMNKKWREFRLEETINEENESPWTWIYKGLLGGWKKAEKKGGNRVEEVAYAVAFLIKTEYGGGAKKDFLKEFNRRIK